MSLTGPLYTLLCLLIALLLYSREEIKYLFFRELKTAPGIITKMESLNQKTVSNKWELTCSVALNFDSNVVVILHSSGSILVFSVKNIEE